MEKVRDAVFFAKQNANNNDYGYTQKRGESPFHPSGLHHSVNVTPIRSHSKGVPSPFRYQDFKERSRCADSEFERTKDYREFTKFPDYSYTKTPPFKPSFKYY